MIRRTSVTSTSTPRLRIAANGFPLRRSPATLDHPRQPVRFRYWLTLVLVCAGAVSLVYGLLLFGFGTLPYRHLLMIGQPSKWVSPVIPVVRKAPPNLQLVTNAWRRARSLPPRVKLSLGRSDPRSPGPFEDLLWAPEASNTPQSLLLLKGRMFQRRVGEALTAPSAFTLFVVSALSAVLLSTAFFLVLAGVVRIWVNVSRSTPRSTKCHLSLATVFGGSALCFFCRVIFVSWAATFPPPVLSILRSVHWEPWSFAQALSDWARYPASWSLLAASSCDFALFSMASALKFASIRTPDFQPLSIAVSRTATWYLVALFCAYFVFSLLLQTPLSFDMLLPYPIQY